MGSNALSRDFARARAETLVILGLAIAAGLAIKVPELFGLRLSPDDEVPPFYFRNASLFVLPLLAAYFVWQRGSNVAKALWLALPFAAGAVFANVFPFRAGSDTEVLAVLHLPIALWLALGFAYVRGRWFADGGQSKRSIPSTSRRARALTRPRSTGSLVGNGSRSPRISSWRAPSAPAKRICDRAGRRGHETETACALHTRR